ncbi:MAG: site-2 protease family protein [Bryobacteraceae bacterium]
MTIVARVLRCCFCVLGLLLLLAAALQPRKPYTHPFPARVELFTAGLLVFWGVLSLIAWWKLRSGASSARRWAVGASLALLLFPIIGTLPGLMGLLIFSRRKHVAAAALAKEPAAPSIPGDGTSVWLEWGAKAAGVAALWTVGSWWTQWALQHRLSQPGDLSWALQLIVAVLVSVAIHEAGHATAGVAVGMTVRRIVVGPLNLLLQPRLELRFQLKGLSGGGLVDVAPRSLDGIEWRTAILIAAGPAASLAGGAGALAIALASPGTLLAPSWWFLASVANCSLIGGIWNLVPMRAEPWYSDGAQLYHFLTDGPMLSYQLADSMVASSQATPLRPRNWDSALIERSVEVADRGMPGLRSRMNACTHHLDAGRMFEALENFAAVVRRYDEASRHVDADTTAEIAYCSAILSRNPTAARAWWDRVEAKGGSAKRVEYWRAHAAVSWLEDHRERAVASLTKAEELARRLPQAGAYDYDRASLVRLRVAIEEGSPAR